MDIQYGIIGCSVMGNVHADALAEVSSATLAACCDVDETAASRFASEHDCKPYRNPVKMIEQRNIDAVSVCTPNGTHSDIVVDIAETGVDILCEKPLDITLPRVDRMIDACDKAGVTLGCVFQRRTEFGPQLQRRAGNDGRLGDLTMADVTVKCHRDASYYDGWHGTADQDGGVLLTQALHGIDLLQWIVGDVERVCAEVKTRHHDIEVPDTAVVCLEFENGAVGQISASTAIYPQYPITINVHGTDGSIRTRDGEVDEFIIAAGDTDYENETVPLSGGIQGQIKDFIDAIRHGRNPMITGREGRVAVAIAIAAAESSAEGHWVDISEFRPGR